MTTLASVGHDIHRAKLLLEKGELVAIPEIDRMSRYLNVDMVLVTRTSAD